MRGAGSGSVSGLEAPLGQPARRRSLARPRQPRVVHGLGELVDVELADAAAAQQHRRVAVEVRRGEERQRRVGEDLLLRELLNPGSFELGAMVATPGALVTLEESGHIPPEFLVRHKNGDWGELPPVDVQENERSLARGGRLLSAYHTRREDRIWVITESDRSATTLLLPEDY